MSDALDRIRARVEAHTAAAPPPAPQAPANAPAEPVAPPQDSTDLAGQVADLNEQLLGLSERVALLEQAATDDALNQMDAWGADPAMAALPTAGA